MLIHMVAWPVLQISQRSWRKSVLIFVSKAEIRILILKKNKKMQKTYGRGVFVILARTDRIPPFSCGRMG